MEFQDTPLDPRWVRALADRGLVTPTPIQAAAWGPALARRDLILRSGTGTGKTLAYLLPIFQTLDVPRRDLQALILVPTQELAVQIQRQMDILAGSDVRTVLLIGGVNLARQIDLLKAKPHIVVGTPGRIHELLEKRKLTGHHLSTVVLDEVDRLVDRETLSIVAAILKTTLKTRQTIVCSASFPPAAEAATQAFLRDPVRLFLDEESPIPRSIVHGWFRAERREKTDLVRKLLHALPDARVLVFLNHPEQIEMVAEKLSFHGVSAASLHGSLDKAQRQKALEGFAQGKVTVLVASDLAARGLDIPGVTHVIHHDLPEALEYQHRCGRTGRAGKAGTSLVLADEVEAPQLRLLEARFGITMGEKLLQHGRISDRR